MCHSRSFHGVPAVFGAVAALLILAGCAKEKSAAIAPAVPEVKVMTVIQRTTPVQKEFVGQIEAVEQVELRAKVSGTLDEIKFQEGALVKRGQPLFAIESGTYDASLSDAKARLVEAAASLAKARQDVARFKPLVEKGTISRKQYDDAVAREREQSASVDSARAVVEQKQLGVKDTLITSPIDGRIGRAEIKVGGLVEPGTTLLATVSTLDPMYVTFSVSEGEYLQFAKRRQAEKAAGKEPQNRPVKLILGDGSEYPYEGSVNFVDRAVSSATGSLTVRAKFPNPDNLLRPGMYAKVRAIVEERENALLVPQKAVQEVLGKTLVTVVGPNDKAEVRPVRMGPRVGTLWIVDHGLKPGDRVVVEGTQKARPGAPVKVTLVSEQPAGG